MTSAQHLLAALLDESAETKSTPPDINATLRLARTHRVLLRAATRLGAPGDATVAREAERTAALLALMDRVSRSCRARAVQHVFLTTLEGYPDAGRDLDLLVLNHEPDSVAGWLAPWRAMPQPRDLGDRISGAVRYVTDAGELDVHVGRLGHVGEDVAFARALVDRRRLVRVGGVEFFAPAVEDWLVLQGMRCVYTRRGVRLSDVIATIQMVRRVDAAWGDTLATAQRFGVLAGLSCYLGYIEQLHREIAGVPLLPPAVADFVFRSRWGRIGSRHGRARFPTAPLSASLYLRKLSATVASGQWAAAARLCLIPVLGARAAVRRTR